MSENYYFEQHKKLEEVRQENQRIRKIKRNIAGGLVLLFIFGIMFGGVILISKAFGSASGSTDSGVAACKRMAENVGKSNKNETWGEPEYHAARMPFESSSHADIKVAGTNIVDTIWQMEKQSKDEENLGGALVTLTTVQTQWAALQTACANHGVTVPPLPTAA